VNHSVYYNKYMNTQTHHVNYKYYYTSIMMDYIDN